MEYKTCMKDETGEIKCWCEGLPIKKINDILENHPKWRLTTEYLPIEEVII